MKSPVSHPQNDAAGAVPRSSVDPPRGTSPERSGDKRCLHVAQGLHAAQGFAAACAQLVAASDKEGKEGMFLILENWRLRRRLRSLRTWCSWITTPLKDRAG